MSLRLEKILVLFFTLILCSLILAWSFFLNFGEIEITSNHPFEIHGLAKQPIVCSSTFCLEKVPIGQFNVTFKSDKFKDINANVEIRRWRRTEAILTFEYKPVLIEAGNVDSLGDVTFEIPFELEQSSNFIWDQNKHNLAYLKTNGTKTELMLWSKSDQKETKITNFYDFEDTQIYWGKTGEKIIVRNKTDFYLVDLTKKLKYKTQFSSDSKSLRFSPNDQKIIYSQAGSLYFYDFDLKESFWLDLPIRLPELAWQNENTLLYFQNTETETNFFEYDLEEGSSRFVFNSLLLNPQNLQISTRGKELEFESEGKKYELRLVD